MAYRYIGNKSKLAGLLTAIISEYVSVGDLISDPMCGTGAMSEAFREAGFRVCASDIMTYAVHHARVRLLLDDAPSFSGLSSNYDELIRLMNSAPRKRGFFWTEYSPEGTPDLGFSPRSYFTPDNASKIDGVLYFLNEIGQSLSVLENSLLRHDLIMSVNDVANIAGTYGHFRSKWSKSSLSQIHLAKSKFLSSPIAGNTVLQGDISDISALVSPDACYIDPPYTKRQYAANYHILETIARGDLPEARGVSGLRDWWDQHSDFCSKVNIWSSFHEVFEKMDCPLFFISYSEDGLVSAKDMTVFLAKYGSVSCREIPYRRFKSNHGGLGGNLTEYLFVLQR